MVCAGVSSGKLTQEYRSQPVPSYKGRKGDVITVVGKSFADIVLDPEQDVFLEVYSPNCGTHHCIACCIACVFHCSTCSEEALP